GWLLACGALACAVLAVTRLAWLSVAAMLVMRVCFSLFQPLQMELQNRWITSADRATALSVNALLMEGVGAGANLAFGAAAQTSLPMAMGLGALLCLAGLALFGAAVPENAAR
ncbi:MAG: hypothetical protein PHY64_07525, partial [Eubacteriales bacterium]|nr:hypothetical protein [Eubacteriales bacterium]